MKKSTKDSQRGIEGTRKPNIPPSRSIAVIRKQMDRKERELKSAEKKLLGIKLDMRRHQENIVRSIKKELLDLQEELYGDWSPKNKRISKDD